MGVSPADIIKNRPELAHLLHRGKVTTAPAQGTKPAKAPAMSSLEAVWANRWDGPALVFQHVFCPGRKWAMDYAHLATRVGVELHGGVWTHGRHVRGGGFVEDRRKINTATSMGWRVFEFTADDLDDPNTFQMVRRAILEGGTRDE